jgi:hypothetical protein
MQRLKGEVAVVTGTSRGAGRGIALVLGERREPGSHAYNFGNLPTPPFGSGLPGQTLAHSTIPFCFCSSLLQVCELAVPDILN